MAKNEDLFKALMNNGAPALAPSAELKTALESLIQVDLSKDLTAFRKAITDKSSFWEKYPGLMEIPKIRSFSSVGLAYHDPNYLTSDDFLNSKQQDDYSFTKLRQLAVEQRVKLGLKDVEDAVLIDILQNNPDQCRAYLAEKNEFNCLTTAPGWQKIEVVAPLVPAPAVPAPAPVKAENKSTDVLTDAALINIKKEALEQLLLRRISNSTNEEHLKKFSEANAADLKTAAKTLGIQEEIQNALTLESLTPEVKFAINVRINKLKEEAAQASVDEYVKNLTEEQLLDFKEALEGRLSFFKARLSSPYNTDLVGDALTKAKNDVAIRFLQVYLATRSENLIPAINTTTAADLKAQLKLIPSIGDHEYIDSAITDGTMHDVRSYLIDGLIAQQKAPHLNNLLALDKADTLTKFKTELGTLGVTNTDWVVDSDMSYMKQWARDRAFKIQVESISRFGESAHSHLIDVFNTLSVPKQREILKLEPQDLDRLLNAKEPHIVAHYLGRDAGGLADIAEENRRLTLFKGIHNSEVARVLANFKPSIMLDPDRVQAINKAFVTNDDPPISKVINFNDPLAYKTLIDAIKVQSGAVGSEQFYKAFDLDATGNAFDASTLVKDAIALQHRNNVELINVYHEPGRIDIQNNIYDVFLNVKKAQPVTRDDLNKVINPPAVLTPVQDELKSTLQNDLTPLVKSWKDVLIKQTLETGTKIQTDMNVNQLNARFDETRKSNALITKNMDQLTPILDVKDVHLMNPAFQGKARSQSEAMLESFKNLEEKNVLILDQLRRNRDELKSIQASLPDEAAVNIVEYKKPVKELGENVTRELEFVKKSIAHYEQVEAKLYGDKATNQPGILEVIDNAAKGKNQFVYKTEGFKYKVYNNSETIPKQLPADPKAPAAIPAAEAVVGERGKALAFLLDEKIGVNQVGVHDFEQEGAKPGVTYSGRFLERHTVSKEREPTGTFTIEKFPKWEGASPPPEGSADKKELEQAQFTFSMGMAVQILANQDEKPSAKKPVVLRGKNKDMLQHLYSALITLGLDKKAIKVESSAFDPAKEHGVLGFGFNSDSLKYKLFDSSNNRSMVQKAKEELQNLRDQKSDKSGVIKKVATAAKQSDSKRDEELKKTEETIKAEGPASRGPGR